MRERHVRKRLLTMAALAVVPITGGVAATAYVLSRHDRSYSRPSGIPAAVPDSQVNPSGRERYLASPQVDHTTQGSSYLPADQIAAWGRGIAQVARLLAS